MSHKYKVTLWTVLPVLILLAVICTVKMCNHAEPLSPQEILAKQDWNQDELAFALARNFKHQAGREGRREVLEHLQQQMQKFSAEDQDNIKIKAITQAIDDSIQQYRALKPEEKSKLVEALQRRAEKNCENVNKMNSQQRRQMRDGMNSKVAQAAARAMQNAMVNKLSPDERRDFVPIEKLWLNTIERL